MLTFHYVIRCIFTNECAREPLRCPMNPMTPYSPCEVVPTSRTLRHKKCIISKICPTKMVTFHYGIRCFFTSECAREPLRCPMIPMTPHSPCEVVPTSRTPRHKKYIISKIRPTKMVTLHYVIRCIFTNEYAREPLRCPMIPMTPHWPCEVVPTSRIPRHKKYIISKIRPTKMLT